MGLLNTIIFKDLNSGIPGVILRKRISLTSAELLALNTTPKELIAAPGAGKSIEVTSVIGILTAGATQYTGANAVEIRYENGSGVKATGDLAAAWLNSATSRTDKAIGAAVATLPSNKALVAVVPTANPGAGDGTVSFSVIYRIVTTV